jgi:hypothetical protein
MAVDPVARGRAGRSAARRGDSAAPQSASTGVPPPRPPSGGAAWCRQARSRSWAAHARAESARARAGPRGGMALFQFGGGWRSTRGNKQIFIGRTGSTANPARLSPMPHATASSTASSVRTGRLCWPSPMPDAFSSAAVRRGGRGGGGGAASIRKRALVRSTANAN